MHSMMACRSGSLIHSQNYYLPHDEDCSPFDDISDDTALSNQVEKMLTDPRRKLSKLGRPFLERVKREAEHVNMNERTPDALRAFARRKLETDRLQKEELKVAVRELSWQSADSVMEPDFISTMSRISLSEDRPDFSPRTKRASSFCPSSQTVFKRIKLYNCYLSK